MKYKKFKQILELQKAFTDKSHKLYKLGVDLITVQEDLEKVIDLLWSEVLNEEGYDSLNWFIYEKDGREDFQAWDKGGVEIMKDVRGLYEYLVESRCFKC